MPLTRRATLARAAFLFPSLQRGGVRGDTAQSVIS
jgi:hypothetical protein